MRISKVRQEMLETGDLPPDKRNNKNKGVRREWLRRKRQEAEERTGQNPDHDEMPIDQERQVMDGM